MDKLNDLFLLMFTLSQMTDERKIIKLFRESVEELFHPFKFTYSEQKPDKAIYFEEISTRNISYGVLMCNAKPPNEIISIFQNAVQMLAIILDRLHFQEELQSKAHSFESIAKKRLEAIKANVKELENSRKQSLNLIENLKTEILERKKIEDDLRLSEEKFRLSFQTSPDAFSINRLSNGHYIDINQGFTDITGYKPNEIIGKTSYEIDIWVNPDDRERLVREIKEHGKLYNLQAKFRTKDGKIIDGLMSASLINLNNIPHIINITRDISKIKEAQDELKKSELRFRKAFENSASGMCIATPKGKFLQVNSKLCEILGYSADELLGTSFHEITFPDDIELAKTYVNRVIDGEIDAFNFEKRYIRKDGRTIWGEVSSSLIKDSENNPVYFISHIIDITKKKKADDEIKKERDQAQRYLDVAGVMFASLDSKGAIVIMNKKGCEILGYNDSDELIGKNWFDLCLSETNKEKVKNIFKEQMTGNIKAFEYYENPVITKSGEERIIAFHNTVLLDPNGQITGVLFSGEDITEREKAKKSLLEMQHHLTNIYNTVGDVIYYLRVEKGNKYRFVSVNEMFCQTTGLQMEQVVGKMVSEVIPEPSLSLVLSNYKRAIEEKSIVRWEETTPYLTGERTGDVSIAPVFDQQGNCTYLVGAVHDITKQKKAEEEIRNLAKFPSENPYPVLRIDLDGNVVYANDGATPLLEAWGCKVGESLPMEIRQQGKQIFNTKSIIEIEVDCNDKFFACTLTPMIENNYINIYGRDITESKKVTEEIKKLNAELEKRVADRTIELQKANKELEELNDVFVGREMRIIELREEIVRLKNEIKEK